MSSKLMRHAYERLIAEDLEWLNKQPHTLENEHIRCVLECSADLHYPPAADAVKTAAKACLADPAGTPIPCGYCRPCMDNDVTPPSTPTLRPSPKLVEWADTIERILVDVGNDQAPQLREALGEMVDAARFIKNANR